MIQGRVQLGATFHHAGSLFEAGFGAVSGGAAQVATLQPSAAGRMQFPLHRSAHIFTLF